MTTNPNDEPPKIPNNGPISHDYSNAQSSNITSTDEDKAKLKALSEMLGIDQHREELDKLNTSVTYLAEKMGQIADIIDKQSKIINSLNPNAQVQDSGSCSTSFGSGIPKSFNSSSSNSSYSF